MAANMNDKELAKRLRLLREDVQGLGERIRRYSMDPFLKVPDSADRPDPGAGLRTQLNAAWEHWSGLRVKLRTMRGDPSAAGLDDLETASEKLEREIDLVQRELISNGSYRAGRDMVGWMLLALGVLVLVYLFTHGVRSLDFTTFEPWPEWGPMKYGEVAFWSAFGAFCSLLFRAAHYLARRDFDRWYIPWYVTTLVRAPFLTVVLMMVVLEFVEWYGEGTWIQVYLLEEGAKFYFLVFLSFCLGLTTDATSGVLRDLSEGVTEFVSRAAGRVAEKLGTAVSKGD